MSGPLDGDTIATMSRAAIRDATTAMKNTGGADAGAGLSGFSVLSGVFFISIRVACADANMLNMMFREYLYAEIIASTSK